MIRIYLVDKDVTAKCQSDILCDVDKSYFTSWDKIWIFNFICFYFALFTNTRYLYVNILNLWILLKF